MCVCVYVYICPRLWFILLTTTIDYIILLFLFYLHIYCRYFYYIIFGVIAIVIVIFVCAFDSVDSEYGNYYCMIYCHSRW